MSFFDVVLLVLTFLIMSVGVAGSFLPVLPAVPIVYAGYFIWGLASGWQDYGLWTMIFWGAVAAFMQVMDYLVGAMGAKRYGASRAGIWGAVIGGIVGLFLGIVGLIIGPFIGAVGAEMLFGRNLGEALRSGWGTFVGLLAGSLFKFLVCIVMVGTFIWLIL